MTVSLKRLPEMIDRYKQAIIESDVNLDHPFVQYVINGDHSKVLSYLEWKQALNTQWGNNTEPKMLSFRDVYVRRFAWHIITLEVVEELAAYLKGMRVVDAGCGSGYLSKLLSIRGIDVTGVDKYNSGYEFEINNDLTIINEDYLNIDYSDYDAVILAWPNYGAEEPTELLGLLDKQTLLFQGEGWGGCTASDSFFEKLENEFEEDEEASYLLNKHNIKFDGIHDNWTVYHRKGRDRSPVEGTFINFDNIGKY